jgi:hypothetical protein
MTGLYLSLILALLLTFFAVAAAFSCNHLNMSKKWNDFELFALLE